MSCAWFVELSTFGGSSEVGLECAFTSKFNLEYGGCNSCVRFIRFNFPNLKTVFGRAFSLLTMSLSSLSSLSLLLTSLPITRDVSECELKPGSSESGGKCSNKRRICRALLPGKRW